MHVGDMNRGSLVCVCRVRYRERAREGGKRITGSSRGKGDLWEFEDMVVESGFVDHHVKISSQSITSGIRQSA